MVNWPIGRSTIGPTTIDRMMVLDGCNWELSVEISSQTMGNSSLWSTIRFGRPSTETMTIYGRQHNSLGNELSGCIVLGLNDKQMWEGIPRSFFFAVRVFVWKLEGILLNPSHHDIFDWRNKFDQSLNLITNTKPTHGTPKKKVPN